MITEIRRQFDLAWALADLHLSALSGADFLWEPAPLCWTVRPDGTGRWYADFADVEPQPAPVPTIGWLTWHIDYWWSATLASLSGRTPPTPAEVAWAGDGAAAVRRVRSLADQWRDLLSGMTSDRLTAPSNFPWGPAANRTVADTTLWVTVELVKNTAEIGQLRLLRAAR